jgi:3-dehydroquinate dehydratase II
MTKILLVQGANLTFLGRREPAIYGSTSPAELDTMLQRHAQDRGYQLDIFYTNVEGEAINRIYQGVDEGADGLIINPAGFTYAGYALKDCIKGAGLPYVEVHISMQSYPGDNFSDTGGCCRRAPPAPTPPHNWLNGSPATGACRSLIS